MLSKNVKARLEWLKNMKDRRVTFHKSPSMSGKSETLRYKMEYFDKHYRVMRYKTGMVLSVTIKQINGKDDPKDLERYYQLCEEAINYYKKGND